MFWRGEKDPDTSAAAAEVRLPDKYTSFRRLLALNSECLELMAGLIVKRPFSSGAVCISQWERDTEYSSYSPETG